jgi:Domain of unknown function (DUF1707)
MTPTRQLRAADTDRREAAGRLLAEFEAGRLDLLEYDDRLARAYRAVTYADLDALFADLPAAPGRPAAPTAPAGRPRPRSGPAAVPVLLAGLPKPLRVLWTLWLSVVSLNLCVWLLVSIGNGRPDTFWPMWLAVPGAILAAVTLATRALRGGRG